MKNEFDNLIRQEYEKGALDYEPLQWQRMNVMLDANEKSGSKKFIWLWLSATGIAASIALAVTVLIKYQGTEIKPQQHFVHQQKIQTHTAEGVIASPNNSEKIAAKKAIHQRLIHYTIKEKNKKDNTASFTNEIVPSEKTSEPVLANNNANKESKEQLDFNNFKKSHILIPENLQEPVTTNYNGKTSLGLAGGVNYGSLNTGYMLSVNAQKNLSRHFYVEGSVAVINNTSTSETTSSISTKSMVNSTLGGFTTAGGTPNIATITANGKTTITNNLYYIQFHPAIGYMPTQKISVSVGADVQRMTQGDDIKIYVDNIAKLAPNTDIGLTGKTEYAFTKRLKAGVLYREGMNNLLNGTDKYFDRRYVQVQLKFIILK